MSDSIRLRNVRMHNLKGVDLDLPKGKLIGFCGPSGSGKSSLAIDTLYAEGQRRYLDTFSTTERGQLEQPEKPDADEIEGIPPAIAIVRSNERLSSRFTVGTLTELLHYFQLVFSQYGRLRCPVCRSNVAASDPESVSRWTAKELSGASVMIGFDWEKSHSPIESVQALRASGFVRCLFEGEPTRLESVPQDIDAVSVLVDRIRVDSVSSSRLTESIEGAFRFGGESCFIAWSEGEGGEVSKIAIRRFSSRPACDTCGVEYHRLSPSALSFNSLEGSCSGCDGVGAIYGFDQEVVIRRAAQSLKKGASPFLMGDENKDIRAEVEERLGEVFDVPLDALSSNDFSQVWQQVVDVLEKWDSGKNKKKSRVESLRRWLTCNRCMGTGFNQQVLSHAVDDWDLGRVVQSSVDDLFAWAHSNDFEECLAGNQYLLAEVRSRLDYLQKVGVGYLTLARKVNSLSTGERQRVAMTNALGSKLVNLLYVFDEPCSGLHPADLPHLIQSLKSLADKGNTVVAVDHDLDLVQSSAYVAEFGPGAGVYGGNVTFAGSPDDLKKAQTITADYLNHRRALMGSEQKREPKRGRIELLNACGNNLKNIDVEFPLSLLCVVTGVSGSGKSSLVADTLFPVIHNLINQDTLPALPCDGVKGVGAINEIVLVDQSAIGANSRSNPATYTKAFDAIRNVFAETLDAKTRNIKAGRFSFNTEGGRCEACKGEGMKQIDMQFLANLHVKCKFCKGLRYKKEVLQCKYRGQSIADVLNMTVREAFSFFRGQKKVQTKLKPLMDVGLDYLGLGQPATTLSSGESQRLRLAGFLASGKKARTLFVMDEPTVGLHYSDVVKLLDCFDALLAEGHSIIVVEHNRLMMNAADYLIDLGPGAGAEGGLVVAHGTPEQVARNPQSKTGQVLADLAQSYEKSNPSSGS